jgi:hypothetical protein
MPIVVVPVPALFVTVPVLLNADAAPPPEFHPTSFWIVSDPSLLKIAPLR